MSCSSSKGAPREGGRSGGAHIAHPGTPTPRLQTLEMPTEISTPSRSLPPLYATNQEIFRVSSGRRLGFGGCPPSPRGLGQQTSFCWAGAVRADASPRDRTLARTFSRPPLRALLALGLLTCSDSSPPYAVPLFWWP